MLEKEIHKGEARQSPRIERDKFYVYVCVCGLSLIQYACNQFTNA